MPRGYHPYQAGGSAAQLDLARDAGAAVGNGEAGMFRVRVRVRVRVRDRVRVRVRLTLTLTGAGGRRRRRG